jgi:hypothetical protein
MNVLAVVAYRKPLLKDEAALWGDWDDEGGL